MPPLPPLRLGRRDACARLRFATCTIGFAVDAETELAPTVGKKTELLVFERSKSTDGPLPWSLYPVTPEGLDYLEDCYKKYGPQPIPGDGISIPWPGL